MEIDIIKRETTGTGPSVYHENDTIAKYEIMDGAPVRGKAQFCMIGSFARQASFLNCLQRVFIPGESIPIRLFLAGYDLTPTMRDINKKFSVRYYLNLVLIDEEERRYFKQQVREDECPETVDAPRGVHIVTPPPTCVCTIPPSGNHTMEERRRGEEEHVPSGRGRLSEVRGIRGFWERAGAGRQGRERLEGAARLRRSLRDTRQLYNIWWSSRFCFLSPPPSLIAAVGMKKGGSREHWNSLHEAFRVASGCWSVSIVFFFFIIISWWESD